MALHGYSSSLSGIVGWVYTRVNRDGYALLLPNGSVDMYGNRFWNANEFCCDFRNYGIDDVSALKALAETVIADYDLGPLYLFGYSNGAHMSYRLVCEGTPDLRAIAAISGTDHIDEKQYADATPVSVLHVHGTHDHIVLFEGNDGDVGALTSGPEHYVGAREVVSRWARRSDCTWPEDSYAAMDLDLAVPGAETKAFELSCEDVDIELWTGEGTGHVPTFGQAFTDAVIPWLLSR